MVPVMEGPRAVKGKAMMKGEATVNAPVMVMMTPMVTEMVTMVASPGRSLGRHERAGAQDKNGRTRKHQFAKHDALH